MIIISFSNSGLSRERFSFIMFPVVEKLRSALADAAGVHTVFKNKRKSWEKSSL